MTRRHSTRFKLAVFDVAGTTVLDGDAVLSCMTDVLGGWTRVARAEVAAVMGLPKPVAIRRLLSAADVLSGADLENAVEEVHRDFRIAMIERYRHGSIAPAPDAEGVFGALRDAGVRVVLDTGFSRDILDAVLDRLGWIDGSTIDFSIASDEIARGRPYPDLIFKAMALTAIVDSTLVVKIGDTPVDLEQGLSAGCGCVVGVTHGTHTRKQLERPGVHVIDRLLDLPPIMRAVQHAR